MYPSVAQGLNGTDPLHSIQVSIHPVELTQAVHPDPPSPYSTYLAGAHRRRRFALDKSLEWALDSLGYATDPAGWPTLVGEGDQISLDQATLLVARIKELTGLYKAAVDGVRAGSAGPAANGAQRAHADIGEDQDTIESLRRENYVLRKGLTAATARLQMARPESDRMVTGQPAGAPGLQIGSLSANPRKST